MGGLGNQMFQYAAARAIALRNQAMLKLDITEFTHYPLRTSRLGHFAIVEQFANQEELRI
jgi:hypothetical protein